MKEVWLRIAAVQDFRCPDAESVSQIALDVVRALKEAKVIPEQGSKRTAQIQIAIIDSINKTMGVSRG